MSTSSKLSSKYSQSTSKAGVILYHRPFQGGTFVVVLFVLYFGVKYSAVCTFCVRYYQFVNIYVTISDIYGL